MTTRRDFLWLGLGAGLWLVGCGQKTIVAKLPAGTKVVALGDSLTFGYGANPSESYPAVLTTKTQWQIINMGINGNTTADVLARLDDVIGQNPKLVLLGIGGNDVLRRVNPDDTKANLTAIIKKLQSHAIAVILIAQPHLSASALFGKASDNPVYQAVADELGVPLFDKAWSKILSDNSLKSDQIHANAQGYTQFANMLYDYLGTLGYI